MSQPPAAEGTRDHQDPPPLWQSLPAQPRTIAPLVAEIGTMGCILPTRPGVAVDIGFELLVRIALRCINLIPRVHLERLAMKYASPDAIQESVSTTYSGTDAIIDAKMAVIVAVRMKFGLQMDGPEWLRRLCAEAGFGS